jgi:hypothetical protein
VTQNNKSVSIHPSTFTDDLPDLSKMSLEDVVARFKDVEKKRSIHTEPDGEQEVPWMIRFAPVELISSLEIISTRMGISRSVLTKCLSRQVSDWYSNSLDIDKLVNVYNDIYGKIKLKSYTSLRSQADSPAKFSYVCPPESVHTSISTIRWVASKLGDIKKAVGISTIDLLLAGFCWGLTTMENRDWDRSNIERFFIPEATNIGLLINDRHADVIALCAKFNYREKISYSKTENDANI